MHQQLKGLTNRLRCIALVQAGEDQVLPGKCVRLPSLDEHYVAEFLQRNHPELLYQQVMQCSVDSAGNLSLALRAAGHLIHNPGQQVMYGELEALLDEHVTEEELTALSMLSLVHAINLQQLPELCAHLKLDAFQMTRLLDGLARRGRFVKSSSRSYRVWKISPPLVARHLFPHAWQRWAASPKEFVDGFPECRKEAFRDAVAQWGSSAAREYLCKRGTNRLRTLTAADLKDPDTMIWVRQLIEIDPQEILPRVRRLFEGMHLPDWETPDPHPFGHQTRRELIPTLETATLYEALWNEAELTLLLLAAHETEPHWPSDNATAKWTQVYSPVRWPSPFSLVRRVGRLKLLLEKPHFAGLAVQALKDIVSAEHQNVTLTPQKLGEHMPHSFWSPSIDRVGLREGVSAAWELLIETATHHHDSTLKEKCQQLLVNHLWAAVRQRMSTPVILVLKTLPLTPEQQHKVVSETKMLLLRDRNLDAVTRQDLEELISHHTPTSLSERLKWFLYGWLMPRFGLQKEHAALQQEILMECLGLTEAFDEVLDVLTSTDSMEVRWMGEEVARTDPEATRLPLLLQQLKKRPGNFVVHYFKGLVVHHPHLKDQVKCELDGMLSTHPEAYALVMHALQGEFPWFGALLQHLAADQVQLSFLAYKQFPDDLSSQEMLILLQQVVSKGKAPVKPSRKAVD